MDYDVLKSFTNNEIEPYLQSIEMWQCITALGIKPFKLKMVINGAFSMETI